RVAAQCGPAPPAGGPPPCRHPPRPPRSSASAAGATRWLERRRRRPEMRALLQRVDPADGRVEGREVASIGQGLLILLGVGHDDTDEVATTLAKRVTALRIFEDEAEKTN